ncbi:methyl-accepting chemotaxis protein [Salinispira pacifica]|uniref:Methyl-accepting chemotaxis protein n=1 Tax=Salinispira pacifica TaxID=1307761 RepID=V5WED1_9SPIO|nr:methyl-accepting chemotaxis protein [Salinispira pacifica]AHC13924.1 hypothetical protein L21SP2_0492 [Salinispira pacifica]
MAKRTKTLSFKITILILIITLVTFMIMSLILEATVRRIITNEKRAQFTFRAEMLMEIIEDGYVEYTRELQEIQRSQRAERAELLESGSGSDQLVNLARESRSAILSRIRQQYYESDILQDDDVLPFILDQQRTVLLHPRLPEGSRELAYESYIQDAQAESDGNRDFTRNGELWWTLYRSEPNWGWTVFYEVPHSQKFAALNSFRVTGILVMLAGFFLIAVLVAVFNRRALRPLLQVKQSIVEIADGGGDLTRQLEVKTQDEVGELSSEFNRFIASLRNIVSSIKILSSQTGDIRTDLNANTEETAGSISQISATIHNMMKQMERLKENIGGAVQSLGDISNSVNTNSRITQEQASMVEESVASVNEMIASINNVAEIVQAKSESSGVLVDTAREGGKQVEVMGQTFQQGVAQKIESIQEFLDVINGISSQINLLSMNAAIEAAHAGEHGRGFAVVAEEIRRLAEQTSSNTKRIGGSIKEIIQAISDTRVQVEQTGDAFDQINSHIEDVYSAFKEIHQSTEELSVGGREILTAMSQLSEGSGELQEQSADIHDKTRNIDSLMQEVDNYAGEMLQGMSEISSGSGEITGAMEYLNNLSSELGVKSNALEEQITRFKTDSEDDSASGSASDSASDSEHSEE